MVAHDDWERESHGFINFRVVQCDSRRRKKDDVVSNSNTTTIKQLWMFRLSGELLIEPNDFF